MSYPLSTTRHSLAHIMAQAVKSLYPEVKLAIGPDIENGFYYDFDFGEVKFEEAALKDIEKKMKNIIKQNQKFVHASVPVDEAIAYLESIGETYKVEMARDLKNQGETMIGFYVNLGQVPNPIYQGFINLNYISTGLGHLSFLDMCRGPHVEKTIEIDENTFKLDKIAGAYWKGSEKNKMLTRVYALAFETREELDTHLKMLEEAKKRDHRILGKKLKLFTISELVGAGLPLMQPKGMIIRQAIEEYLWELHKDRGYLRVWTPHIAKECLYETSGHAAKFGDELFRVQGKEESFIMKPMNCPHHMQIFADNQFSYRDMPIRYFEPATVYRDEKTGQLSGLGRVRSITQDDGHLFCRTGQIKEEVATIVSIIKEFYATMGMLDGYWVSFSVRDPATPEKYLGGDDVWEIAEDALESAAKENGLNYKRIEGEAAFYGPKLDFMFQDALGRERQLATIQCDFNLPTRFWLSYINEQGEKEHPVVIHRAISGSLERFMSIMIEHFAGTFPLWLAPVQTVVVPISENFAEYAREVQVSLKKAGIRSELDDSSDGLNKKVRNAETSHINYILVVGEKEMNERSVAVRNYKTKEQSDVKLVDFIENIRREIENRSL